jgi:hypothetical protein
MKKKKWRVARRPRSQGSLEGKMEAYRWMVVMMSLRPLKAKELMLMAKNTTMRKIKKLLALRMLPKKECLSTKNAVMMNVRPK